MDVKDLTHKLQPGMVINIKREKFKVLQHIVWWQAKTNSSYDKYVLQDEKGDNEYRFYISGDFMGLAKIFHYDFQEPMPKILEYDGKTYELTQDEFCVAKKVEGEPFYHECECEIWWDYASKENDGTGLSLGRSWDTWEREDLTSESIGMEDVAI